MSNSSWISPCDALSWSAIDESDDGVNHRILGVLLLGFSMTAERMVLWHVFVL